MELNICHLYPDILNLYGDRGNIITMKRRLESRGISVNVDECSIGQPLDVDKYDIFFIGGGQDFEQEVLLRDLASGKGKDIRTAVEEEKVFLAICGGYQMMGRTVSDPDNTEGGGSLRGMKLLPIDTVFRPSKTTTQTRGTLLEIDGVLSDLSGLAVEGYEIHMGETVRDASAKPLVRLLRREGEIEDGCQTENAFGTYLHGVFDAPEAALRTAQALAQKKGVTLTGEALDTHAYKEQQYDKLADSVRKSLDMERIYRIMEGKA